MALFAPLIDRAVIEVSGPDWRSFLQGLLTQDLDTLDDGELRFGAMLTPQGRLLFDVFILSAVEACLLDCAAEHADALLQRLTIYRLRAKVTLSQTDIAVSALWDAADPSAEWKPDPRLPALGFRGYGAVPPDGASQTDLAAYDLHRMRLGVPGPADWGHDRTYPIEADFDLLNGVDFQKGCFVGQETTSRMKRRGTLKTRMAPIAFDGGAVPAGAELLAGKLRAGEVHSSVDGMAIASLRLDRLDAGERRLPDGREWTPSLPEWMRSS
jgi:folate-binding protein YgfZ